MHYDGTSFTIAEYGRLLPQNGRFSEGLHTYNQKCGVTVIDGVGFRRGVLSRFLNIIDESKSAYNGYNTFGERVKLWANSLLEKFVNDW